MAQNKDASARVVIYAIVGNGVITISKFFGWFLTFSPSMLAEGIHSLADTCNQGLLYVGIIHGQRGSNRKFPLGRGHARYLWNLISAIGIFFVGFGVTLYHGIHSLITSHGIAPGEVNWIAIGILIFALVVEGAVLLQAWVTVKAQTEGQRFFHYLFTSDDPTAIAVLFEDGVAVLGVLLALAGIWLSQVFDDMIYDSIASIIIACLLGGMAIALAYANGRLLIGVSADASEEEEIRNFIEQMPEVEKVIKLSTTVLGPGVLRLGVELEFHGGILIDRDQISRDAERIRSGESDPLPVLVDTSERMVRTMGNKINDLERKLRSNFPELSYIDIEVN